VYLGEGEDPFVLRCDKRVFDFSGHSTRDAILDYILRLKPAMVFLVHGDDDAVEWFRAEQAEKLPTAVVIVPEPGVEHVI
jgi:predicted metal-dependent RNase